MSHQSLTKANMNFILRFSLLLLLLSYETVMFCHGSQIEYLNKLIESRKSDNHLDSEMWSELEDVANTISPVYIGPQEGLMAAEKIDALPMQPPGVDFNQYAGYVTVEPKAGRALFYYFVESPQDSSTKPLILWLNGGPGCSSFGYGAMEEIGPFRVNSDGKLFVNEYAWNKVANVLFLESPAGVGFSYSNSSSDYGSNGDKRTAEDSYTFLINWLERFPQYKTRDFYITGESYAGHYVPQLAYTILAHNKNTNRSFINLKSIAIGNAYIHSDINVQAIYDYFWSHAMISDETHAAITKYCDFLYGNYSDTCGQYMNQGDIEIGNIDIYNIYAPLCNEEEAKPKSSDSISIKEFDPCSDRYVESYLNQKEVQQALHAINTTWSLCSKKVGFGNWKDMPRTVLPVIGKLIANQINVWIYSGDIDGRVPVTASRYAVNTMNLPLETSWRPWYSNGGKEVGGYVEGYKGLTLLTIRGAGHAVPSYQPDRSLTMISSFLQGKLPPTSS